MDITRPKTSIRVIDIHALDQEHAKFIDMALPQAHRCSNSKTSEEFFKMRVVNNPSHNYKLRLIQYKNLKRYLCMQEKKKFTFK